MRKYLAIALICLVAACTAAQAPETANVTVVINYGDHSRSVPMKLINQTAFDAFNSIAKLDLEWYDFDGDGVKSPMIIGVDGVEQTATNFWIFYVNESMAAVGAGDYRPSPGETLMLKYESSPF